MRKITLFLFMVFLSIACAAQVPGVTKRPMPPIKNADAVKTIWEKTEAIDVDLFNRDTLPQPVNIVIDTVFTGNFHIQQKINSVRYGYIRNKLVRLSVVVNNSLTDNGSLQDLLNNPSHSISFYLDETGVIAITEHYVNGSRMGSCGNVGIKKTLYYWRKELLWETIEQNPYPCYSETIVPEYYSAILKKLKIEL